jgi:hypothetical protein
MNQNLLKIDNLLILFFAIVSSIFIYLLALFQIFHYLKAVCENLHYYILDPLLNYQNIVFISYHYHLNLILSNFIKIIHPIIIIEQFIKVIFRLMNSFFSLFLIK